MSARHRKNLTKLLTAWFVATLSILSVVGYETAAIRHGFVTRHATNPYWRKDCCSTAIVVRGGFSLSEEDEGGEEIDEYEGEDDSTEVESTPDGENALIGVSKRVLILLRKGTIATASAIKRAVLAAFQGHDAEEEEEQAEPPSTVVRVINALKRMWAAVLYPSESEGSDIQPSSSLSKSKEKKESSVVSEKDKTVDFGTYLATAYGVKVDRDEAVTRTPVMGGTLGDALRDARSKARLLVAFIPSSQPGRGKKTVPDQVAIQSLLSEEVAEAAEKRARKKVESGSFVLWGAKTGSPEAVTAIKRLRVKQTGSKGGKRALLLVAYPAQVLDSSGAPKLVPRLLAQHHCNPPPSSESMSAWLNALRKRHSKQYTSMQHDLKELKLFKERQAGYRSSVVSDVERQEQEKKAEEERLAKEKAEKQRLEELERRREELKKSLPEEPGKDAANAMTIALRFANGRSGQRRFAADTPVTTVFNWVDALYQFERETVILTTMNGQRKFTWDEAGDIILGETGLGRMTGLRVTKKKNESEEAVDEQNGK